MSSFLYTADEAFMILNNDPLKIQMEAGLMWGDICLETESIIVNDEPLVANPDPWAVRDEDALEGFEVPDLTLRKGIWTNFPVVLKQLHDGDGTDRYSVEWHYDNLWASFETNAPGDVDFGEWKEYMTIRLFHSLNVYSRKYIVEEPRTDEQICVIAMVHAPVIAVAAVAGTVATTPVARRRALDVLKASPISWDREGAKHSIKVHRQKCRELGLPEATVKAELLANLAQCPDCVVSAAPAGYLCVVTLL